METAYTRMYKVWEAGANGSESTNPIIAAKENKPIKDFLFGITRMKPEIYRITICRREEFDRWFLAETYKAYRNFRFGGSKEIGKIVVKAYLLITEMVPSYITSSPMIAQQPPLKEPGPNPYPREKHPLTWNFDHTRYAIRYAYYVYREPIFTDLFTK